MITWVCKAITRTKMHYKTEPFGSFSCWNPFYGIHHSREQQGSCPESKREGTINENLTYLLHISYGNQCTLHQLQHSPYDVSYRHVCHTQNSLSIPSLTLPRNGKSTGLNNIFDLDSSHSSKPFSHAFLFMLTNHALII